MSKAEPIAVLIADLHLTLLQPACRADKDWMGVQQGYLEQIKALNLPVVCAGDIFDRWNPPPELINFALKHLPTGMVCVPGQHDLPLHRRDLIHRSGYGVLVEAGKIIDISNGGDYEHRDFIALGFGWNEEITPLPIEGKDTVTIAVIHRYCWEEIHKYPGAPDEARVSAFKKALRGYDVAVFGDNHKGFTALAGDCQVINCGGFITRKSDEINYKPGPGYGLLMSDGTVERHLLDTSKDKFHKTVEDRPETPFNMKDFVSNLEDLGESGLDFKSEVENHLRKEDLDGETKEIILKALGN